MYFSPAYYIRKINQGSGGGCLSGYRTLRYQTISVPVVLNCPDTSVLMQNWSGHFVLSTEMSGDTSTLIVSRLQNKHRSAVNIDIVDIVNT